MEFVACKNLKPFKKMRFKTRFKFVLLILIFTGGPSAWAEHRPVVHISSAQLLNADRKLIADITGKVRTKDNLYAAIHNGEYVRVAFEKILNRNDDNVLYVRPSEPKKPAIIEVYPVYADRQGNSIEFPLIATFPAIDREGFYKVFLTSLQIPTKTFDLKVKDNGVDIDYIIDPVYTFIGSIGTTNYGSSPESPPIVSGSTMYGMASAGGASGKGLIYSIGTTGGPLTGRYMILAEAQPMERILNIVL